MTIAASAPSSHGTLFPDTHWSSVRRARGNDSAAAKQAIDSLCATYWKPIYGYIRYLGQSNQDAEDLTQEFFRQLMVRGNLFLEARREQGKLRTYVCVAVKRLVTDSLRKQGRLKRGGAHEIISLEEVDEITDSSRGTESPDERFDRHWAKALVERTLIELERDYVARRKGAVFSELRPYLGWTAQECQPQDEVALRLGITVGALRMALSRVRQRFGELFRKQVEATVPFASASEVDQEITYLIELFAN